MLYQLDDKHNTVQVIILLDSTMDTRFIMIFFLISNRISNYNGFKVELKFRHERCSLLLRNLYTNVGSSLYYDYGQVPLTEF